MTSDTPLLERELELSGLAAVLDDAVSGHGRVLLIEAPAGAGKSSLLDVAAVQARDAGFTVLRGAGAELERDFAFGAVRQLFEPALTGVSPAERDRLLGGSAAAAAAVIEPVAAPAEGGFALFHALYWLLANLAEGGPYLLLVDDLHWVDDASLSCLDFLARRLEDLPVALVGALRPAEPGAHAELLAVLHERATVVSPAALSRAAVAELVRAARNDADDETCAAYHAASAGNPLYLRQLLSAAPDSAPAEIRAAAVPTLGEQVLQRIRRLGPEAPALTGALAVLGDGHSLATVTELAELDPTRAAQLAVALTEADILLSADPPAFVHPVIRHSVYAGLSPARRASMHATAAERLEAAGAPADAVATHLAVLPPAGSAAVAARLVTAAEDAMARAAPRTAIRRLERALAEGAAEPSRPQLLYALGRAEVLARNPAFVAHLQEAFELATGALRAQIAIVLSEGLAQGGQWAAAWSLLDAAGDETEDPALELRSVRAVMAANDPQHAAAFRADWDNLVALSERPVWGGHAIAAVLGSEAASQGHPPAEVRAHVERALRDRRLLTDQTGGGWAPMQVVMALVFIDALDEAEAFANEVWEEGRRTGSLLATFGGLAGQMWAASRRGRLTATEANLQTITDVAMETGMAMWLTSAAYLYQDALAERPSLSAVADQLMALEIPPDFMATHGGAQLEDARGRLALTLGDTRLARVSFEAAAAVYRPLEMGPVASPWRSQLALSMAGEDPDAAATLAAEELALARAAQSPRATGVALRALGAIQADAALLEQSLAELEHTHAALERAYTRVELGRVLREAGKFGEAREHLSAGADLASRCGAERLLARATEELRAAGARPRRIARTGRDALTPRELRVAELAAAGLSNAEIAQQLFLSLKTVETHLTSGYAKLGLSGQGARTRLPAALAA